MLRISHLLVYYFFICINIMLYNLHVPKQSVGPVYEMLTADVCGEGGLHIII